MDLVVEVEERLLRDDDIEDFDELVVEFQSLTLETEDGDEAEFEIKEEHDLGAKELGDTIPLLEGVEVEAQSYSVATIELPVQSASVDGVEPEEGFEGFDEHGVSLGDDGWPNPIESHDELHIGLHVRQEAEDYFLQAEQQTSEDDD